MSKLVVVASYENEALANVAKNILEDEQIRAVLFDDGIVTMDWLLSNAVGGVKVKVREEDAERASALLKDHPDFEKPNISEEELAAEALAHPREDEDDLEPEVEPHLEMRPPLVEEPKEILDRDRLAWRAFVVAWLSVLVPPMAFYSVYLWWEAALSEGPLSYQGKTRLFVSGVILVPLIFLCIFFVMHFLK